MNESEMAKLIEIIKSSLDPIFIDLPDLHKHCKSSDEADLPLIRAALRLRERYSYKPFTRKSCQVRRELLDRFSIFCSQR